VGGGVGVVGGRKPARCGGPRVGVGEEGGGGLKKLSLRPLGPPTGPKTKEKPPGGGGEGGWGGGWEGGWWGGGTHPARGGEKK